MKDINLIPSELKYKKIMKRKRILKIIFGIVTFTILLGMFLYPLSYKNNLQNQYILLNSRIDKLKATTNLDKKIREAVNLYNEKKDFIEKEQINKTDAVKILKDISFNIPEKVSIKSINYKKEYMDISGEAVSESYIADFMFDLRNLDYIKDIRLISINENENGLLIYNIKVFFKVVS
ncbi:MAG: PilN domain-containing protein [Thermoanaerobacteraceae bacterium]